MTQKPIMLNVFLCGLASLVLIFSPLPAMAQNGFSSSIPSAAGSPFQNTLQSSPQADSSWNKAYKSRVRIISGATDFSAKNGSYAGIQIQMSKGWKTYWRSPGDSGVPPSFDWSGSDNLKHISIEWPVPKKYKDQYSTSIGYKSEVILPLKITATDASKPVKMKLRLGYGICSDICVPVEKRLKLTIPPRQATQNLLLSHYRKMVPKPVASTGKVLNGFSFRKVSINLKGKKPNIVVETSVPLDTKKAELYVEASNGFYLPLTINERPSAGNQRRFIIDLTKSDPPKDLVGRTLAFTLVGDKTGIVYTHKIN